MFDKSRIYFLTVLVILLAGSVMAQDLSELEKRYGFKDILLETRVGENTNLEPAKHHKEKVEGVTSYQANKGAYPSIGEIKIHAIRVLAFDSLIYEISVITEKDANLYKGLERAFGKPQNTVGYGAYTWKTDKLSLTFRSHGKSKLELVYHAYAFEKWKKEEKQEKIDNVSSDF